MENNFKALTVVEEDHVNKNIEKFKKSYPRFEDGYEALKWRLARQPDCGMKLDFNGTVHYLIKSQDWQPLGIDLPPITVVYTFDNNQITLRSINVISST